MQLKSPSASGSITTTAGRLPMATAKSWIQVRYAAGVPAPPPEWLPQASRPGMLYATSSGSLSAASAAPTKLPTAEPIGLLQLPNQRALGLEAIEFWIAV